MENQNLQVREMKDCNEVSNDWNLPFHFHQPSKNRPTVQQQAPVPTPREQEGSIQQQGTMDSSILATESNLSKQTC